MVVFIIIVGLLLPANSFLFKCAKLYRGLSAVQAVRKGLDEELGDQSHPFKSGFVSIIGNPNVGKFSSHLVAAFDKIFNLFM